MSKPGTIQLRRSFFPEIELIANSGYESEPEGEITIKVGCGVNLRAEDIKAGVWTVNIVIDVTWPKLELPPYAKVRLIHFGVFDVNTDMPDDVLEKHLSISAPSMLYSGAREFMKILTASGPYPPVMLPSTQFRHEPVLANLKETASSGEKEPTESED